jgi:hypothetical protein
MIGVKIRDALFGTKKGAGVTNNGELITAPLSYSVPIYKELAAANTAYNFIKPKAGCRIVITTILLFANRNVGANDATVVIYEADSADSTTETKVLFQTEMLKQSRADITGVSLLVNEGKWVNAKTNDDDVFLTIAGYHIGKDVNTSLLLPEV